MKLFVRKMFASPDPKKKATLLKNSILKKIKNRRKKGNDRRRSSDTGVTVNLSTRQERRSPRERREKNHEIKDFVTLSRLLFHSIYALMASIR